MLTRSDDLAILLAVVDTGGFSAAADSMQIQVARVSRSISRLESQLGTTLLNRTTRRVELTEEGRDFVDRVRQGLDLLQLAEEDLVSRDDLPRGKLRVDAASPFVLHQLVPLVSEFRASYPDIQLELTSNEGFVDLLEKRTDVAIRIGTLSDSSLHARSLGQSKLHIVASPDYLSRHGTPEQVQELAEHSRIGLIGARILNQWPLQDAPALQPDIQASNGETVRQLVLAGNGLACLSGFMVNQDIQAGRLVSLLDDAPRLPTGREQVNAVYYKSSSVARRISAFIDFIQPRLTL